MRLRCSLIGYFRLRWKDVPKTSLNTFASVAFSSSQSYTLRKDQKDDMIWNVNQGVREISWTRRTKVALMTIQLNPYYFSGLRFQTTFMKIIAHHYSTEKSEEVNGSIKDTHSRLMEQNLNAVSSDSFRIWLCFLKKNAKKLFLKNLKSPRLASEMLVPPWVLAVKPYSLPLVSSWGQRSKGNGSPREATSGIKFHSMTD